MSTELQINAHKLIVQVIRQHCQGGRTRIQKSSKSLLCIRNACGLDKIINFLNSTLRFALNERKIQKLINF